ncbi:hypothetical protein K7432_013332 [Basidiobolus ranarum]|uniref:DNA-directed DNA polymerase n=1 Tax=Basidiobolus ranarum TaxID=34480 RepID=A0ABR2WJE8_9FUNG
MPKKTKTYRKGKIGVYNVTINGQTVDPIIIPNVRDNAGDSLNWKYDGPMNRWITNVDIELLEATNCDIIVHEGYIWDNSRNNIFTSFILPIVNAKQQQDKWKTTKDHRYNPSLRECLKLAMNSLSGKFIQRPHTIRKEIIQSNKQKENFFRAVVKDSDYWFSYCGTDIAIGKIAHPKVMVPTIWGILIYAYARRDMYISLLSQVQTKILTDTDSLVMSLTEYKQLRKNFSELFGEECGQLREEVLDEVPEGHEDPYCISIAPKCYCIYTINKSTGEETPIIMRFKGVNSDRDKVIFNETTINKIKHGKISPAQLHNIYYETFKLEGPGLVSVETYKQMAIEQKAYILCSLIKRSLVPTSTALLSLKSEFRLREYNSSS